MARVSTIPTGIAFVDALAQGLLAEVWAEPLALADYRVLLPNRRAGLALRAAFLRAAGGRALILPRIQPIGDLDADELLLDGSIEADLPPAIDNLSRRLLLARLLAPLGWPPERAFQLAGDLAALLDELQTEDVPLAALDRLVPDDLAEHWQQSRQILAILGERWPEILAAQAALDPAARRNQVLAALAARWQAAPPAGRIVAAGSTGSMPATRHLLATIAALPRGEVVLPGLDRGLDEASWQALPPSHPQAALQGLLTALGIARSEVADWPGTAAAADAPRVRLLSLALRPAASFAPVADQPLLAAGLAGLSLSVQPDLGSEARAIALRLRAWLEQPGRSAALITLDRQLARRVAAELRRWRITIDDSAGTPLDQTAPGSFLLLTLRLLVEGPSPIALLAALKHPFAQAGLEPAECRRRVRELERACLRGPRIRGEFRYLLTELTRQQRTAEDGARRDQLAELHDWLTSLARWAESFMALAAGHRPSDLAELARAHLHFAEALASARDAGPDPLWERQAGEAAAQLFADLLAAASNAAPLRPAAYQALLGHLLAETVVRPQAGLAPRLAIWSPLEARLQQPDLVILGGLNEGVWPRAADPGPWLNERMRADLGLPPQERRIGQSAHDFAMAAAAGEVVLSRAMKDAQGNPTVPCRWLVRLGTVLQGVGLAVPEPADEPGRRWLPALDRAEAPLPPLTQPRPRPPLAARPRRWTVSEIALWLRDPYALYAKRILRLQPLQPLEAEPDALERGNLIHDVLEQFVREHPGALPEGALQRLTTQARQAFARFQQRPQVEALWWPRFEAIARWLISHEQTIRPDLARVLAEVKGELDLPAPAGPVQLRARADRLELDGAGRITIIDYKTGAPPPEPDLVAGLAPQLPLEALLALKGGFAELATRAVGGLQFWHLKGDEAGGVVKAVKAEAAKLAADAEAGLLRLLAHYDRPETTYPARFKPKVATRGDYDHLARTDEWSQ